jgi:serine/threonine protein kinase
MNYYDKYIKYKTKYLELKNIKINNQIGGSNDDYKIIKEIGIGMMGTVYLVKDKANNKYAMKIEKILKKHSNESLEYDIWREIEFSNKMYKKYPNHFMKIYDNWIDKKCTHKQDWKKQELKLELFDKSAQNYYKKLFDSPYCSIKIYSLIDLTLKDIYEKLTDKQYYDIFIQCLYVMYLCNKSGYLQRDWKMDNIGLIKTDDKYINIFDSKIKTHGYKVVLLDYGAVIHKKYILSSYEKNIFRNKMTDLFFMFDRYKYNMIFNFKEFENKYNVDTFDSCTIDEDINKLLPKFNKNNDVLSQYIYKIKYYDKFENQLIGKEIEPIKPKLLLPKETILFIIKNIYNIKKCTLFMIKNN